MKKAASARPIAANTRLKARACCTAAASSVDITWSQQQGSRAAWSERWECSRVVHDACCEAAGHLLQGVLPGKGQQLGGRLAPQCHTGGMAAGLMHHAWAGAARHHSISAAGATVTTSSYTSFTKGLATWLRQQGWCITHGVVLLATLCRKCCQGRGSSS